MVHQVKREYIKLENFDTQILITQLKLTYKLDINLVYKLFTNIRTNS